MSTRTYLISYDVAEGGDYDALIKAIKKYGTYAHITQSTWAVVTEGSAVEIRDDLLRYLVEGSRLVVVRSGTESAWTRSVICSTTWLRKHL